MRYGQGWGMVYGDPETYTITLATADLVYGASVTFYACFSQWYQLIIDGVKAGTPAYVKAGTTKTLNGRYASKAGPHTITVAGSGPWSAPRFNLVQNQAAFTGGRASKIHLDLIGANDQFSVGDGGQLSAWNVSGV